MYDQSDSQNKSEEQAQLSEGTSPSSSYDEGSRSTPSNLPKAATRTRKKKTSDSEDEDYIAVDDDAISKRKVVKKEFGTAASTKPGMNKKAPARRVPTSKPRKVATGETLKFTIESKEEAAGEDKKKKRARTTTAKVLGKSTMVRSDDEEEEDAAQHSKLRNSWEMQSDQGLLHLSPKLLPRLLHQLKSLNPRGTPEVFRLRRRTRPQCLKLQKRKLKPKC